jgi:hypothetical protein
VENSLNSRCTGGASVNQIEEDWRLEISQVEHGNYRLAQIDDYVVLRRRQFLHSPPWRMQVQAKVSSPNLPGTWGFGLWNDPFGFSLGFGRTEGRLPVLPNAAWFFHASNSNWLSLRDEMPANGFFAGTWKSPRISSLLLAPTLFSLPILLIRPFSRILRRLLSKIVKQDSVPIHADTTNWHDYTIEWLREFVIFKIDNEIVLHTELSPRPPLGLVIWIDNQFAAWTPEGRLGYGTLDSPDASLEIKSLVIGDRSRWEF